MAEAIKAKEAHGESPTPAELQAQGVCTSEPGEECQPGTAGFDPVYLAVDNSNDFSAGDVTLISVLPGIPSIRSPRRQVQLPRNSHHRLGKRRPDLRRIPPSIAHRRPQREEEVLFAGGVRRRSIRLPAPNSSVPGGQVVFGQDENDFVAQGVAVHEFGPTGTDLGRVTGPDFTEPPTALASDLSNGQLYIADSGGSIRHYDTACEPSVGPCVPTDTFGGPNSAGPPVGG